MIFSHKSKKNMSHPKTNWIYKSIILKIDQAVSSYLPKSYHAIEDDESANCLDFSCCDVMTKSSIININYSLVSSCVYLSGR